MLKVDPNGTVLLYQCKEGHFWQRVSSPHPGVCLTLVEDNQGNGGVGLPLYVTSEYFREHYTQVRVTEEGTL